jgi:DNA-binding CsgD family transcriptional regulator
MPTYKTQNISAPKDQAALEVQANKLGTVHAQLPAIAQLRAIVPFDQYALSGLDYPGLGIGAGVMLGSDMPPEFLRSFLDQGLYRQDPMSAMLSPETPWASWHDLSPEERARPELGPIRLLQTLHGVSTRSVIAFYRGRNHFGGATFTRDTPFTAPEKFILEAAARMIHTELSDLQLRNMAEHTGLNVGEVSCLNAASHGMSAEDCATTTGFTVETVASYIKSATKKLGANNRTQAVAEAIRRRLIR